MADLREPRLKACPFCGTPGGYGRGGQVWEKPRLWTSGCPHGHAISPEMDTIEEAARWWNRRSRDRKETSDGK